jgi:hypothetical protein
MILEIEGLHKHNAAIQAKLNLMSTEKLSKRRRVADSDSERKDSRIQELEDIIEDLKAVCGY